MTHDDVTVSLTRSTLLMLEPGERLKVSREINHVGYWPFLKAKRALRVFKLPAWYSGPFLGDPRRAEYVARRAWVEPVEADCS